MTAEGRKLLPYSLLIVCGMTVCMFFYFRHSPHRGAFQLAFDILFLANFALISKLNWNRRQPDTLTHLFPKPSEDEGKI